MLLRLLLKQFPYPNFLRKNIARRLQEEVVHLQRWEVNRIQSHRFEEDYH